MSSRLDKMHNQDNWCTKPKTNSQWPWWNKRLPRYLFMEESMQWERACHWEDVTIRVPLRHRYTQGKTATKSVYWELLATLHEISHASIHERWCNSCHESYIWSATLIQEWNYDKQVETKWQLKHHPSWTNVSDYSQRTTGCSRWFQSMTLWVGEEIA